MKFLNIITALGLSYLAVSCGRFGNEAVSTETDTTVSERIVCISKQYSEIIFALNAEKDIVAVDISSTYPPEVKKLPTVGYHRALSTEAILALEPTLILHDNNIGPEDVVRQLEELEIPMKFFTATAEDISSTKDLIREMGKYFGKEQRANELCDQLDKDMNVALENAKKYVDKPRVLVIHYGQASNVYLVMTQNSTASKMIGWAGAEMAVSGDGGMEHLSAEIVAASNPDVILITDFGYDRLGSKDEIGELPGVAETAAFKNGRLYRIEEHDLVYLGPRTGKTTLMLQKIIHEGIQE